MSSITLMTQVIISLNNEVFLYMFYKTHKYQIQTTESNDYLRMASQTRNSVKIYIAQFCVSIMFKATNCYRIDESKENRVRFVNFSM